MIGLQRALLGVLGAFWLTVGALAVIGTVDFGLTSGARVLGVLMLGNAAVLIAGAAFSAKGCRWFDLLLVVYLAANAVLSITDDIGVLDAVSLVLSMALAILVALNVRSRRGSRCEGVVR